MKKTIVLNNKMTLLYNDVYEYINNLNNLETNNNLIVCPSSIYLETFINNCSWGIGSQNVYYELSGDYTGELSTLQLKSLGVEYILIGNNERKKIFKESNKDVNLKLKACLDSNIIPILYLDEKEIDKQLEDYLKGIDHIEFITFVYEDKNNELEDIIKSIDTICDILKEKYHSIPNILYDGYIDKDNINSILNIDSINGIVLGSESSDIDKIKEIINNIN